MWKKRWDRVFGFFSRCHIRLRTLYIGNLNLRDDLKWKDEMRVFILHLYKYVSCLGIWAQEFSRNILNYNFFKYINISSVCINFNCLSYKYSIWKRYANSIGCQTCYKFQRTTLELIILDIYVFFFFSTDLTFDIEYMLFVFKFETMLTPLPFTLM